MKLGRMTIYQLVDEQGGGILPSFVKCARTTKDSSQLDELIEYTVQPFLYNAGKGKLVSVSKLITRRNKERNAMRNALMRTKRRGDFGPNILDYIDQDVMSRTDFFKALKILDGENLRGTRGFRYREMVWDIEQRGKMGESLLHICLLLNTSDMNELAKRLCIKYPVLVNDIFISEDYYGLSPLHQAIVNEDIEMVYFLCRKGADVHQRCYGAFFCADDQKSSRSDSLEHEWVDVNQHTRYTGQMYWGEYPLSFAACTQQFDCFRLLIAFHANPNMMDTNGNTVLHLAVIHNLPEVFHLACSLKANMQIRNNLKLTPLALSARMANKKMFDMILEKQMQVVWEYGRVKCKAYPLDDLDTINEDDGSLNVETSVLANVVYGGRPEHLEFFDGLLEEILIKKWQVFGKRRLLHSLSGYLWYLFVIYGSFMMREGPPHEMSSPGGWNFTDYELWRPPLEMAPFARRKVQIAPLPPQCHLWDYTKDYKQQFRLLCEFLTLLAICVRTVKDLIDIHQSGLSRWWMTLSSFPEKVVHKLCQALVFCMVPIRLGCTLSPWMLVLDDVLAIIVVFFSTLHFLFYCRSLNFVGPFVMMVYKIIAGDMIRFFMIYSVFLVGFSQAFFVIFSSCERAEREYARRHNYSVEESYPNKMENMMHNSAIEAVMVMFIISAGEFASFYDNLNKCKRTSIAIQGKIFFVFFELLVTVMLLNLLIAMMTRTYETILETEKEWKRQWAQVILMVEQSLSPSERLLSLHRYSRPWHTDKRQRAFVVKMKEETATIIEKSTKTASATTERRVSHLTVPQIT